MDRNQQQSGTGMRSGQASKISQIKMLLGGFASLRRAELSKEDYQLFATKLERYQIREIEAGLNALAEKRVGQYEPRFPEIAAITEAIDVERRNHAKAVELRMWRCTYCRGTQASAEVQVCMRCGEREMREERQLRAVEWDNPDRMKHPKKYVRIAEVIAGYGKKPQDVIGGEQ